MNFHIDTTTYHVSINPKDPEFFNNPYPYYEKIREVTPVFFWEEFNTWCFLSHQFVDHILRSRDFGTQITHIASRDELGIEPPNERIKPFIEMDELGMLGMEGPNHHRIRGLVQKAFMNRQISNLKPRIEELSHQLIDKMESGGEIDLLKDYATPIPIIIITEMLGIPTEMSQQLLDWSHAMVRMYHLGRTKEDEENAVIATNEFSDYLQIFIAKRKKNLKDDLISQLITVQESGEKLSEKELIANCILLLNAGHEATVHVIGNGVKTLLSHPTHLEELKKHPEGFNSAIEEIMRFDPPLHYFSRYVLKDFSYAGLDFPFKTKIGVLLGAANRDPEIFDKPEIFNPSREKNPHLAFGGGIHFCVGAPLARLELQTALPILFKRVPNLRIIEEPKYGDTYHFHGLEKIIVEF
jgi:cytochrome P450